MNVERYILMAYNFFLANANKLHDLSCKEVNM